MNNLTHHQIASRYQSGQQDVDSLIGPLIELSQESSSLVVGYGVTQAGIREEMIPYFHVCGAQADQPPVKVLIVGGWTGTESVTPYAVARLLVSLESRLRLVAGIEITAYPVANLEAHRQGVFLTEYQETNAACCWEDSRYSHIQVLESELKRNSHDIVILLRENNRAQEADIEAWLVEDEQKTVISDALKRHATAGGQEFRWRVNPVRPAYPRCFTPIPQADRQPAEIIVGLPGARDPETQAQEGMGLILALSHAIREARLEGLL